MSEAFSMADRVVIMSRGKIEQIGTPEEIYRKPNNRFVADFLGSSNVFSGNLASGGSVVWKVDANNATYTLKAHAGVQRTRGAPVAFAVSSENMSLAAVETPYTANCVEATVVGSEFAGASATVFLETDQGQELKVQKGHEELKAVDLRVGQRLLVHWLPEHCHVLPDE
jgi:spermidine/putrescine transport system ATP-binding protein